MTSSRIIGYFALRKFYSSIKPEHFKFANEWIEEIKQNKTYDEVLLDLVNYFQYVDTQIKKIENFEATKSQIISKYGLNKKTYTPELYSNLKWSDTANMNDTITSQSYNAYFYFSRNKGNFKNSNKTQKIEPQALQTRKL